MYFLLPHYEDIVRQYCPPFVIFPRLQIDKELIIGYDYTNLRSRSSCYVKIASGNSSGFARVKHFCLLRGPNGPECFAGIHLLPKAQQTLYSFPFVYVGEAQLTYISIAYIKYKINLFPIFANEESSTITGYWVTPTSISPPNAGEV